MSITLDAELEAKLNDLARLQGKTPDQIVSDTLRAQWSLPPASISPRDEWESKLLSIAKDCGVSPSNEDLSRENLYD
jgi:predicted transcriptional regulator